ncbi:MAG: HAD family hydrolase [Cytophagales bacterium]|nr:HAD family hydrolase [Cytophagales bacterium]
MADSSYQNLQKHQFDRSWTLFLDRDGVINKKIDKDYVRRWEQFEFLPDVLESIHLLSKRFGKIIIVTNQRGIGLKLMTKENLEKIHALMLEKIKSAGGSIDKVYYCPHLDEDHCNCRKPSTGLALQAKKDFPGIDFKRAIMVGDSQRDMEMGEKLGMITMFLAHHEYSGRSAPTYDFCFDKLISFAKGLYK